jgi:SPASM domain peptide maturase of grasp-with-spasm system
MIYDDKKFYFFESCKAVKGAKISILCDLQRSKYAYISQGLYEILTEYKNNTVAEIKAIYKNEYDTEIDEYFTFLASEDYIYFYHPDQINDFPEISLEFETPDIINNAIIDIDENSDHPYEKIISELEFLGCKYIQFRIYNPMTGKAVKEIISFLKGKKFLSVQLFLHYSSEDDTSFLLNMIMLDFPNINYIVVFSVPEHLIYNSENSPVYFTSQKIIDEGCCGKISKRHFSITLDHFSEAQKFNTCLNKKISIDKNGIVKNCPTMDNGFGSIKYVSLIDVAYNEAFKQPWSIHKDQIKVCKDCQFRYICTDCRAFVSDSYDKPKKCGYDPYTHTWNTISPD